MAGMLIGNITAVTLMTPNDTNYSEVISICQRVLTEEINNYSIRIWDMLIMIPNVIFIVFMIYKFRRISEKLRRTQSPVFTAFFSLVYFISFLSILRCIVVFTIKTSNDNWKIIDKALWLFLRFCFLSAELSFLMFALLFGHLESSKAIRRALFLTLAASTTFTIIQTALELSTQHKYFYDLEQSELNFFTHGGMAFYFVASLIYVAMYILPLIVPHTPLRRLFLVPERRPFYFYCFFLFIINSMAAIGALLVLLGVQGGICIIAFTSLIYYTCYVPVVYIVFLKNYVTGIGYKQHEEGYENYRHVTDNIFDDTIIDTSSTSNYRYVYRRFSSDLLTSGHHDTFAVGATIDHDDTTNHITATFPHVYENENLKEAQDQSDDDTQPATSSNNLQLLLVEDCKFVDPQKLSSNIRNK